MKIRPWAEFTSSLPEDQIEDGAEIIQYGGKSVAEAIAEDLRALGCVVEAPTHAHEHGWDCNFKFNGRTLWFQVTLLEGYLLLFGDRNWFSSRSRPHPAYVAFMKQVGPLLRRDDRFENLRWYDWGEALSHTEGTQDPVVE